MSETLVAGVTLFLGWLAYTLSTQRFYADLLDRRMDAYYELVDCFSRREMEARTEVVQGTITEPRPAQQDYFAAQNKVFGLFGDEVIKSIEQYDKAFLNWLNALHDITHERSQNRIDRYSAALAEMYQSQTQVGDFIKPYIRLGRRGVPLTQRLRITFKSWRSDRNRGG